MDTAIEALFKDMLNNSWFTNSEGDVNCPLGYFGWVFNRPQDLFELRQAFESTIKAYGNPKDEDIIGNFFANISDQGIIRIIRYDTLEEARKQFDWHCVEYAEWLERQEETA